MSKHNARVFIDVLLPQADEPARIVLELFTRTVPTTADHFRSLFAASLFTDCEFHRCVEEFMIQFGDHSALNELSPLDSLEKEGCLELKQYDLVMANDEDGHPSNQLFILTSDAPHLKGTHVVLGRLISGFDTVHAIEHVQVDENDQPLQSVQIVHSGELIKQHKPKPSPPRIDRSVSRSPSPQRIKNKEVKAEPKKDIKPFISTKKNESEKPKSVTAEIFTLLFGSHSESSSSSEDARKKRRLMHSGKERYDAQGRKIKGRGFTRYRPS